VSDSAPEDDVDSGDPATKEAFTVQIVEAVVAMEPEGGARGPELARRLDASLGRVRAELNQLESLGIVYRTGAKRGTRWWVG
jgi:DNA-binding GntR family transcriptional regulator